jgi:hypothetical protein
MLWHISFRCRMILLDLLLEKGERQSDSFSLRVELRFKWPRKRSSRLEWETSLLRARMINTERPKIW